MSGKKDKQRFKYKNTESIDSVFNYVATINKGLKSRRIGFGDDDDMIEMSLPDDVELSIEAGTRKGKGELTISLAWKTPEPAVIAPDQKDKKKDKKKKDKNKGKKQEAQEAKEKLSAPKAENDEANAVSPADVAGAVADEAERKAEKRAARKEVSKKRVARKQPARKSTAKKQPSGSRSKRPAKRTPPGKKT